jgi:F0F1-type ATP synthase membrane subunit b/b'
MGLQDSHRRVFASFDSNAAGRYPCGNFRLAGNRQPSSLLNQNPLDPIFDFVILFPFSRRRDDPCPLQILRIFWTQFGGAMSAMALDLSVVLIVVMVWALYFVLKKSFFDPVNQILDARDSAIHGSQQEAREKLALADRKSRAYADSLKGARLESYRQQEAFRAEAVQQRAQILTQGRQEAGQMISSARHEVQSVVSVARNSLEAEVTDIADGIVKSILR